MRNYNVESEKERYSQNPKNILSTDSYLHLLHYQHAYIKLFSNYDC